MTALPGGVYLVLDEHVCAAHGRRAADVAAAAVESGVQVVQVRAKQASARRFVELVVDVAAAIRRAGPAVLVVNDRVDVALAARARGAVVHGVHVGQRDLDGHDVRALLGADALVGVSASRPDDVEAVPAVADYVGTGPVRATSTKPDADQAVGFVGLAAAVRMTTLPVVAIGGLGAQDVAAARRAGAHGFAVVTAVCAAPDPGAAAADLVRAWAEAAVLFAPASGTAR